MSDKEIREKAALLADGQIVEIDGNNYKAVRLSPTLEGSPCYYCEVECNCHYNVLLVCFELENSPKSQYHLQLIP